jgi:3-phenylpropionate/cinnamic acid dioxygenase small subunit
MRILVLSNLYPPIVRGGFEVECSGVVERLAERHSVLVLTSNMEAASAPADPSVLRELTYLTDDSRGALRQPAERLPGGRISSTAGIRRTRHRRLCG